MPALGGAVALEEVHARCRGCRPCTCTSMWRPCSTYFSTRMVSSPNADAASRFADGDRLVVLLRRRGRSACPCRRRRPRPSPAPGTPRAASAPRGTTGTPAATAISRAASLRPICSITSADGPTSVSPACLERLGEGGPLGQEAVAGVDRLRAGVAGGGDDRVDVEVARHPDAPRRRRGRAARSRRRRCRSRPCGCRAGRRCASPAARSRRGWRSGPS